MYPQCIVFLLAYVASVYSQSNSIKEVFTDDTNKGFNHLTVNKLTGTLYVGAVNKIYMLNDQLIKLQDAVTGPELDNPDCFPPSIEDRCVNQRTFMDSYNKALVIDYSGHRIIACTSLFQGICEKRKLTDISKKDTQDYTPMVANNATASTVVFIANGPYYPPSKALYIGVTWTKTGPGLVGYRGNVPAFCSRNLTNFDLVYRDISANSKKEILIDNRDTFPVIYVYGFESDGFSYVVTIQKENLSSRKFISKLIRVCQKDKPFYSYVETRLECYHSGSMYNLVQAAYVGKPGKDLAKNLGYDINTTEDVLYAVFSIGQANSHQPTGTSALCIYPMSAIKNMFTANIQKCFDGNGTYGVEHMEKLENCGKSDFDKIRNDYCGTFGIYYPIDGSIPNKADAAVQFKNNDTMSAIHVSTINDYTVAFVGTASGHLKKVVLETGSVGHEYEDIVIDEGKKINADLHMDTITKDYLYALTPKRLSKILVHDCSRYTTCNECISALDPYCGWCSLESICSLRSKCAARESELGWVPYNKKQCTSMNLHPDQTQIDANKTPIVTLRVINLPQITMSYECAFKRGSTMLTTQVIQGPATTSSEPSAPTQLQCSTPSYALLPEIPLGQDHITMILSLRMDDQDFVSKNFTFFDCSVHVSCSSCTLSDYPCTWCVKNHRCTNRSHDCLNGDTLVTGQNVKGMSHNQGPANCPMIDMASGDIMTYIPSGTRYKVQVQYSNLQPFQKENLRCFFLMRPNREVSATIFENTSIIKCGAVTFSYESKSEFMNVPFEVRWGDGKILDNPQNIQVQMYKCDAIAASCGQCLTMKSKYNCGWCDTFCTVNTQCPNDWLNRQSSCPNPQISSFYPLSGPVEGGTKIVISGINLGKEFKDIRDGVFVAGIRCETIESDYEPAEKIICITSANIGANERTGKVIIYIEPGMNTERYSTTSKEKFHYVIPVITDIKPNKGPIAGGTEVTIFGKHIDAGSTVTVTVGDLPCINIRRRNSSIHCKTTESNETKDRAIVQVNMDKESIRGDSRSHFKYLENPVVLEVTPLTSIRSGGLTLIVKGVNFDTIQEPMIVFWLGNEDFINSCQHWSDNTDKAMKCVSPNLASNLDNFNLSKPMEVEFGFIMDDVKSLLLYTKSVFEIYKDPIFHNFDDPNQVLSHQKSTEYIIITGDDLLPAISTSDVKVIVGDKLCQIHSIGDTAVTFKPPPEQPTAINSRYPEVIVTVGRNLTFHIGYIRYEEPEILPIAAQIGIGVGGGILLLVLVCVICAYKRKSRENKNTMRRMQVQMDTLESKVAKECKEAFAELQTDMTELTSDHEGQVSIPYLEYRDYCIHVLFPGIDDQQLIQALQSDTYYPVHIEDGLRKFSNLLGNKTFLLIFVRTLEANKHFTMHDRVRVASLINVSLQSRMEYSTEVLKTLLAELIEKSVDGDKSSSHPKLLLRRTESVAEKMLTNWFTFLLYKFLKECTGEPLFVLYQAMKQQIAKGPVDAITSEARYSLSESKLIRQQIDYKQMTIYVVNMEQCSNQHEHPVKVLDCDSISQVKDKILDSMYKNAPFSSRPQRDTVDLEWHSGRQGKLLLQDEDNTSKTEGDYRRLNTLMHYKIPDGAFMTLVPRQHYNQSIQSSRSGSNRHDNFMSSTRSPSLNRTNSPSPTKGDTDGLRYYHLVKQHDAESHKDGDRGSMMVSEIYLTRLLTAKGTLQPYVDDLFERIFSTAFRGCVLPLAIKYMFDFLDDQAILHQIQDPEVVHTWKSNSLPLRFWVNVIKNPDFVFDINKSNIIDSCLSVMAQTFMDSCSMSEHRLGINSPSSKLLYAKDIPKYKKWVERYYQDIKMMPAISDQDMNAMLAEDSRKHDREFNTFAALHELYKYIKRYMDEIMQALDEDEFAKKNRLTTKLIEVHQAMSHETEEAYC